jgi:hypothetical protein
MFIDRLILFLIKIQLMCSILLLDLLFFACISNFIIKGLFFRFVFHKDYDYD